MQALEVYLSTDAALLSSQAMHENSQSSTCYQLCTVIKARNQDRPFGTESKG